MVFEFVSNIFSTSKVQKGKGEMTETIKFEKSEKKTNGAEKLEKGKRFGRSSTMVSTHLFTKIGIIVNSCDHPNLCVAFCFAMLKLRLLIEGVYFVDGPFGDLPDVGCAFGTNRTAGRLCETKFRRKMLVPTANVTGATRCFRCCASAVCKGRHCRLHVVSFALLQVEYVTLREPHSQPERYGQEGRPPISPYEVRAPDSSINSLNNPLAPPDTINVYMNVCLGYPTRGVSNALVVGEP
jgi:hypothetical protein